MTPNEPNLFRVDATGGDERQKPAVTCKLLNRRTTTVLQWPLLDPEDGLPIPEPIGASVGSGGQRLSYHDGAAPLR